MGVRLHRHGRFRRWLGARLGGDEALGDRVWRRLLHAGTAVALLYYALPPAWFGPVPKRTVLLAALAAVLLLELARLGGAIELPTLRPYEARRVGSYAFYALAVVGAILLFPVPIGAAVVLGTAIVDPLAGELRVRPRARRAYPAAPLAVYFGLAAVGLVVVGGWPVGPGLALAALASPVAVAAEWPRLYWVDDDLAMTLAPALVLYGVGVLALGLPAPGT